MLFSQNPIKLYSPIKWAGNKHFILNKIRPFIEENNESHCFYECFAGSLSISLEFQPRKLVVVDRNYPLINMWKVIKNNPNELCSLLSEYSNDSVYNNREKYEEIIP
jgi:DNA adenine methylase